MNSVFIWSSLPEESNEDDREKEKIHVVDKSYRDGVVGNCTILMGLDSLKLLIPCIGKSLIGYSLISKCSYTVYF